MTWGWVAAAAFGTLWWVTWASLLVIGVGLAFPHPTKSGARFGWLLVGCVAIYGLHHAQPYGSGGVWIAYSVSFLTAAALLAERGESRWIYESVRVVAWMQLPVLGLQAFGWNPVETSGGGLSGSFHRRAVCAVWLGAASLWTRGSVAWIFAMASFATTSLMGLPALVKLLVQRWPRMGLVLGGLALLVVVPFAWARVALRFSAWHGASFLKDGWLTGWGFLPLPGGFVYDAGGARAANVLVSDYHNALLDWVARTGLVGFFMLGGLFLWAYRRGSRWPLAFALWVGVWQSVESSVALVVLWLAWLIVEGDSHVHSV